MTLKIRKRDERWCVVDEGTDGSQETLGCHDTARAAMAQRRAVGMNSKSMTEITKPSAWVHQCMRRYRQQGMSQEEAAQRCYGAWHKRHPGQSTRRCLSCEETIKQVGVEGFYREIVEEVGQWDQDEANYHVAPEDVAQNEVCEQCAFWRNGSCELVEGEVAPGGTCELWVEATETNKALMGAAFVVKGEGDSPRLMFLITSNSYEDREDETITTKALTEYVDSMWTGDKFQAGKQDLLFGHKGTAIGHIGWADMVGPFLVEVAEERDTPYAKRKWDYIEAHSDVDWGASHGFEYVEADKQNDGTYDRIYKFETSIIEVDRAANLLTLAGVFNMGLKQNRLDGLMGQYHIDEEAVKSIVSGLQQVQRALGLAGVDHKQMEEDIEDVPVETPVPEEEKADAEEIAALVLEVMAEELGADNVPEFAPTLAAAIGQRIVEYVGVMAEAEMQATMTDDQQKGLDLLRLEYDQREKQIKLLDQLVKDTSDDAEAITEIADAIKELKPLVARMGALEKTVGAMAKQLAVRPRSASEAPETIAAPTDAMMKGAEEDDLEETKLGLKLRRGWRQSGAQS
jgi:hypothetical protein